MYCGTAASLHTELSSSASFLPSSPAKALRAVVGVGVGVVLVVARSPGGRLLLLLAEEETIEALLCVHDMERARARLGESLGRTL